MQLTPIPRDGTAENVDASSEAVAQTLSGTLAFYDRIGFAPPWISFLASEEGAVVGTGAFKGPPKEGQVEIAYYTFPGGENRGVATRIALALVDIARSADPSVVVTARTLIEPNASHRVLTKTGFRCAGVVVDPEDGEVLEWVCDG